MCAILVAPRCCISGADCKCALQHATAVGRSVQVLHREQTQILEDGRKIDLQLIIGEQPSAQRAVTVFDDRMEYARNINELAAMDSMASSSGPQSAALIGALGRQLIARLHSSESREKLVRKLVRLEKKLHLSERWTQDSAEYQVG